MQKKMKKKKFRSVLRISLIVICSMILVLGGAFYFLIHGYIGKMNIVTTKDQFVTKAQDNSEKSIGTQEKDSQDELREDRVSNEVLTEEGVPEEVPGEVVTEEKIREEKERQLEEAQSYQYQKSSQSKSIEATSILPSDATETGSSSFSSADTGRYPNNNNTAITDSASSNNKNIEKEELQPKEDTEIAAYTKAIKENMKTESEPIDDKRVEHILMIGSDSKDSMVLISFNKDTKEVIATNFLRNIYLELPGKGENQLIAAYTLGGAELFLDTLELNFKIKIEHYIKVDLFTFINIIDELGGITMEVNQEEIDVMNQYIGELNKLLSEKKEKDIIKRAGSYQLNGKQALALSRNRYTFSKDSDQTERQRKVLQAIYNKIYKLNPLELNKLLNTILPKITTNMTEAEIVMKLLAMPSYMDYKIKLFNIPIKDSYKKIKINGTEVIGIDFQKNREELMKQLYHIE